MAADMLNRLDHLPEGFLTCSADRLIDLVPDNTLIEIQGRQQPPLFMSILLHGNETTGLHVAQNILRQYADTGLPRSLLLFIGNVTAASKGLRRLESQPDFNRIWLKHAPNDHSPEYHDIAELMHVLAQRPLFASVDIHNNTGLNPHYACINRLDAHYMHLARLFSRTIIYFVTPDGVQSKALAHLCPAVTLECGQPGDEYGIQRTITFVDAVLNSDVIPDSPMDENDIDLLHTTATVRIRPERSMHFGEGEADIMFIRGIETLNFEEIPAGSTLATLRHGLHESIEVESEDGVNITDRLFQVTEGRLTNIRPLMLSMLTMDERVIRQDCLCYVMERYAIAMGEKEGIGERPVWLV